MKNWEDLRRRLVANGSDAWVELYTRLKKLRGHRHNLGREKDLLHDLFLKLQETFQRNHEAGLLDRVTNLRGYCARTVSNLLLDRNDAGARFQEAIRELDGPGPIDVSHPNPDDSLIRREDLRILGFALGQLSDSDRDLLIARYREGMRLKALAKRVSSPESKAAPDTVRVRVRRARDRLRRILLTFGVLLPSGPSRAPSPPSSSRR